MNPKNLNALSQEIFNVLTIKYSCTSFQLAGFDPVMV